MILLGALTGLCPHLSLAAAEEDGAAKDPPSRSRLFDDDPDDAAASRGVDLLALIDPAKSAAQGVWTKNEAGELVAPARERGWIEAPYRVPGEYDMVVEFTRKNGPRGMVHILSRGDTKFAWVLCGRDGSSSAFLDVQGKGWGNPTDVATAGAVTTGTRHRSVVKVRKGMVSAYLDDRLLSKWPTDYADLGTNVTFPGKNPGRVAVGATATEIVFHRIELIEVSGRGERLEEPDDPLAEPTKLAPVPVSTTRLAPAPVGAAAPPADGRGLRAELFKGRNFEQSVKVRYDYELDFDWGQGTPDSDLEPDDFSVRWNGFLRVPVAGQYRLITYGDDHVKLWLDDKQIVDGRGRQEIIVELSGNRPHALRLDYQEYNSWANVSLHWRPPGAREDSVVPPEVLFVDKVGAEKAKFGRTAVRSGPAKGAGLLVEVFAGTKLEGRAYKRYDRQLDWLGHGAAIGAGLPADNFSVRWTSWLKAPKPGQYKLIFLADDGVRLWLDGKILMDTSDRPGGTQTVLVDLTEKPHALKIEYWETGGAGEASLHWEQVGGFKEQIIPPEAFFTDKAAALRKLPSIPR